MKRLSKVMISIAAAFLLLGQTLPALAAPPAQAPTAAMRNAQTVILGLQARTAMNSLNMGERRMIKVEDPQALAKHGLSGLSAGDEIEVKKLDKGTFQLRDPKSGKTVIVDQQETAD